MSEMISVISTWVFLGLVCLVFSKAINTWDKTRSDFYRTFIERQEK